jgi:hypothetical protein
MRSERRRRKAPKSKTHTAKAFKTRGPWVKRAANEVFEMLARTIVRTNRAADGGTRMAVSFIADPDSHGTLDVLARSALQGDPGVSFHAINNCKGKVERLCTMGDWYKVHHADAEADIAKWKPKMNDQLCAVYYDGCGTITPTFQASLCSAHECGAFADVVVFMTTASLRPCSRAAMILGETVAAEFEAANYAIIRTEKLVYSGPMVISLVVAARMGPPGCVARAAEMMREIPKLRDRVLDARRPQGDAQGGHEEELCVAKCPRGAAPTADVNWLAPLVRELDSPKFRKDPRARVAHTLAALLAPVCLRPPGARRLWVTKQMDLPHTTLQALRDAADAIEFPKCRGPSSFQPDLRGYWLVQLCGLLETLHARQRIELTIPCDSTRKARRMGVRLVPIN